MLLEQLVLQRLELELVDAIVTLAEAQVAKRRRLLRSRIGPPRNGKATSPRDQPAASVRSCRTHLAAARRRLRRCSDRPRTGNATSPGRVGLRRAARTPSNSKPPAADLGDGWPG